MLVWPTRGRPVMGEVAQDRHDARAAGGADLGAVLIEVHVADPVQAVFDGRVPADYGGDFGCPGLGGG